MRIYARERIPHLWIVDPLQQTVESYRLDGERWVVVSTHGGGDAARIEPFHEIELDLARWWSEGS